MKPAIVWSQLPARPAVPARVSSVLVVLGLALGVAAQAQNFPVRPVTFIVPWPPGGGTDVALRALATASEKYLGQPIVIYNRDSSGGTLDPAHLSACATPTEYTFRQL